MPLEIGTAYDDNVFYIERILLLGGQMMNIIDALVSSRNFVSRHIQAIALILLLLSLSLNLFVGFNQSKFQLPIFDWSLLVVGACSGFIILTYVIKAHEFSKWQRFRCNMISDLYEQICDILAIYERNIMVVSGEKRRSTSGYETDYFQMADTPVTVRRFQAQINERRSEVFNRLSLSLVGITSEIANDVAEFKSIYYKLFALTKFIIDFSDFTGPQRPSRYEIIKAESAFKELFGISPHEGDIGGISLSQVSYTIGHGPFERFFEVINCLARNIGLKSTPLEAAAESSNLSTTSFVPETVSGSERSVVEYAKLHSERVRSSRSIDQKIFLLAQRYLTEAEKEAEKAS